MNKKGFIKIPFIVLIVTLVGIVGYFAFQKWQATTPSKAINVANYNFSTDINGYFETCMDTSAIYKSTKGSWEKASTELPGKGLYYLDNEFVGYGMCDSVGCTKMPMPYTIPLVEYKEIGKKSPPSDSGTTASDLPAYQTVPLNGDIKIDIQYFSDSNCQDKKTFSTVLKR